MLRLFFCKLSVHSIQICSDPGLPFTPLQRNGHFYSEIHLNCFRCLLLLRCSYPKSLSQEGDALAQIGVLVQFQICAIFHMFSAVILRRKSFEKGSKRIKVTKKDSEGYK